jgi:hypothetical protein
VCPSERAHDEPTAKASRRKRAEEDAAEHLADDDRLTGAYDQRRAELGDDQNRRDLPQ